jgi:splicing factor U2AF subunit
VHTDAGRFGFVEMRTEELASSAMALDKVELCGRNINVGRPKGYVEPPHVRCPRITPNPLACTLLCCAGAPLHGAAPAP